jgi:hypothetical protein
VCVKGGTHSDQYYAAAIPWYWLLLLTPLLCVASVLGAQGRVRRALLAVLLAASACIMAATALAGFPVVRYLHPVAWLFFFPLAVLYNKCLLLQRGRGNAQS